MMSMVISTWFRDRFPSSLSRIPREKLGT